MSWVSQKDLWNFCSSIKSAPKQINIVNAILARNNKISQSPNYFKYHFLFLLVPTCSFLRPTNCLLVASCSSGCDVCLCILVKSDWGSKKKRKLRPTSIPNFSPFNGLILKAQTWAQNNYSSLKLFFWPGSLKLFYF